MVNYFQIFYFHCCIRSLSKTISTCTRKVCAAWKDGDHDMFLDCLLFLYLF